MTVREGVACPGCGATPEVGDLWTCAPDGCGAMFDTFATEARCPACGAHFRWTQCASCGKASPHAAWYGTARRGA